MINLSRHRHRINRLAATAAAAPIFAATVASTSEIPDGSPGELSAPDTAAGSLPLTGGTPSTLSVSNAFVSVSWSTGALPIEIAGLLATALENALTTTITTAGGVNSVEFTFSAGDHNFDMLADQETLLIVYNVTVANGTTTTTQPLTITVNGTNDAPTITAQMDGAVSAVDLTDTGKVLFEDADLSDTHTASVSFVTSTLVDPLSGLPVKLGSLVAGPAVTTGTVGVVGWNFSVASSDVHKLAFGQTVTETYQIIVSDGAGSATQDIDVTITNNELNVVLTGEESVPEGDAASYSLDLSNVLASGITATVDLSITLPGGLTYAQAADFVDDFRQDLLDAGETGVTVGTASTVGNTVTVGLTLNSAFDGSFTFDLLTTNDDLFEGGENFIIDVSNAVASNGLAVIASGSIAATIVDNDAGGIAWSISGGGNVAEGAAASFTVSYGGATLAEGNTVSINLAFAAGGTEAADFGDAFLTDVAQAIALLPSGHGVSLSGGTLTFSNPAVTSLSFTLPTTNDTLFEGNEAFSVSIADPSSGSVAAQTASATIVDNDAGGIAWSISGGGNVAEGAAASFTVSYGGATLAEGNTVSINLAFAAGGTEAADFGDAFLTDVAQAIALLPSGHGISLSGGTLTFSNPAVTSLSFTLPTTNDTLFEGNEAFSVSIADPSSGSVAAQTASATIVDNDAGGIAWSISGGGNVAEGAAASFTVSYGGATLAEGNTVSINLAFAAGGTEAADFGDAFLTDVAQAIALLPSGHGISLSGGTLTFSNPAVTSLSFTLPTTNDTLFEGNEAFSVSIADPSSGSVAAQTASATIVDNDPIGGDPNDFDDKAPIGQSGFTLWTGTAQDDPINTGNGSTNDIIYGLGGNDTISTGNSADIIYGQAGNDNIQGGSQDDSVYGGSGTDNIDGGEGSDVIYGGSGNDTINGGSNGTDVLVGGFGQDIMTGGNGNDTFQYLSIFDSTVGARDTIVDFTPGNDTIDLSAITTVTAAQGVVTSGTPIAAHSIAWVQNGSATTVYINSTDAAGAADMEIQLTGVNASSLQATDFLHHI